MRPSTSLRDVHEYYKPSLSSAVERAPGISLLRGFLRATLPGRYVPIALTEWNLNASVKIPDLERAVILAQYISEYIKGGVDMRTSGHSGIRGGRGITERSLPMKASRALLTRS